MLCSTYKAAFVGFGLASSGSSTFIKEFIYGSAAVARAGAGKADFTEFSGKSTFGAKMVPKVTFPDFRVPKATCRAKARRCACSQRFLDVFCGPRERKCNFCVQKSLFDTFSTSAPKSHFLAEK